MSTKPVRTIKNSADFLAALPHMTGMHAPESCFLSLFGTDEISDRVIGTARFDLPQNLEQMLEEPGAELENWLRQTIEIAVNHSTEGPVVITIDTDAELTHQPATSPQGMLTAILADILQAGDVHVRDAIVRGSDGWATFLNEPDNRADSRFTDTPVLRDLAEITASPLHDPTFEPASLEQWRAEHPDQTAENPGDIDALRERIAQSLNEAHDDDTPQEKEQ